MPVGRQHPMWQRLAFPRNEDRILILTSLAFEQLRLWLSLPVIAQSVQEHTRDGPLGLTAFSLHAREAATEKSRPH